MYIKRILQHVLLVGVILLSATSCSLNSLTSRFSAAVVENRLEALNRETDLDKARSQMPGSIGRLEELLKRYKSKRFHLFAAQANYSYAYGFIEDDDKKHALHLYHKAYKHGLQALSVHGVTAADLSGKSPDLRRKVASLPESAVGALYWTALSWARMIELSQPDIFQVSQLHKTVILMDQVIKLDANYQLGGAYLFFAVYYASQPALLGRNDELAITYFEKARKLNRRRLLIVDYLQARYLNGRTGGEAAVTRRLKSILSAPDGLYPDQALINAIAKQKASRLLFSKQGTRA